METPRAAAGARRGEARGGARARAPGGRVGGAGRAQAGPEGRDVVRVPPISLVPGNPSNLAQVGGALGRGGTMFRRGAAAGLGARGRDSLRVSRARLPSRVSQQLFSPVGRLGNFPPRPGSPAAGPVPPGPGLRARGGRRR